MSERGASLRDRRSAATEAWDRFFHAGTDPGPAVPPDIAASWRRVRGGRALTSALNAAPDDDPVTAPSSLAAALGRALHRELREVAADAGFLVALADPDGRLVSTHAGAAMARAARRRDAVDGSRWSERARGTNALALALRAERPVEVFAAQHTDEALHGWTCWAAPIRDPGSGAVVGVLDLSAPWQAHSGAGRALLRTLGALVERQLDGLPAAAPVELRLLGRPGARMRGRELRLSPRQAEILAIIALHPDGIGFERLHAHLYGDRPVAAVTLRAELSKLRRLLGAEVLTTQPYRITAGLSCDLLDQRRHLATGRVHTAVRLEHPDTFAHTESPFLRAVRDETQVAVRTAVLAAGSVTDLDAYLDRFPDDVEVLEAACLRTGPAEAALWHGRLATAANDGANAMPTPRGCAPRIDGTTLSRSRRTR